MAEHRRHACSIWGHNAYQAPDWSADWLHRELAACLDLDTRDTLGKPFDALGGDQKTALTYRLKQEHRRNGYDPASGVVTASDRRAHAIAETASYYERLYGSDPTPRPTRDNYVTKEGTLPDVGQACRSWRPRRKTRSPTSRQMSRKLWPHHPSCAYQTTLPCAPRGPMEEFMLDFAGDSTEESGLARQVRIGPDCNGMEVWTLSSQRTLGL